MRRVYCSDAARLRGDDNAGTASRIDVWILVELPVTWGYEPISDAAIPSPVVAALKRASEAIPRSRVVFIRKRVECLGPTKVYVVRSAPRIAIHSLDLPSLDDVTAVDFAKLSKQEPVSTQDPGLRTQDSLGTQDSLRTQDSGLRTGALALVCTHGQHDSCCGRRGYPLFDALRKRDELEVWQCSHIGGDRFAANAVILPWGLYYGPVEPGEAEALADSIAREEIFLRAYRGRASISRPAQAAEIFVRRATGILGRDALRVLSREDLPGHHTRIHLRQDDGTLHDVVVEQYTAHDVVMLTCTSRDPSSVPQFRVVEHGVRR